MPFSTVPWELPMAARAAALAGLTFVFVVLVTGATDEGAVAWSSRLGHAVPVAPLCGALGAWLAPLAARRRGDEEALAALGASPFRIALPAVLGGAAVPLAAALYLAGALGPLRAAPAFFPKLEHALRFEAALAEPVSFTSEDGRLKVFPDGRAERAFPSPGAAVAAPPEDLAGEVPAAALTLSLAGLAFAWVTAQRPSAGRARRVALLAATAFASLVGFQAAGAGRAPVAAPLVPPLLFLVGLVVTDGRAYAKAARRAPA